MYMNQFIPHKFQQNNLVLTDQSSKLYYSLVICSQNYDLNGFVHDVWFGRGAGVNGKCLVNKSLESGQEIIWKR